MRSKDTPRAFAGRCETGKTRPLFLRTTNASFGKGVPHHHDRMDAKEPLANHMGRPGNVWRRKNAMRMVPCNRAWSVLIHTLSSLFSLGFPNPFRSLIGLMCLTTTFRCTCERAKRCNATRGYCSQAVLPWSCLQKDLPSKL